MTIFAFFLVIWSLVLVHEWGHFWVAKRTGVRVERFNIGFGPSIWQRTTATGMVVAIGFIPLGGYVKLEDQTFRIAPLWKRSAIVLAGPCINLLFAWIVYSGLLWLGGERPLFMLNPYFQEQLVEEGITKKPPLVVIEAVSQDSPFLGKVHLGDEVIAINGTPVVSPLQLIEHLKTISDPQITLQIRRMDSDYTIITPIVRKSLTEGMRPYLGLGLKGEVWHQRNLWGEPLLAWRLGFHQVVSDLQYTFHVVAQFFKNMAAWDNLSGPISIANGAGRSFAAGPLIFLHFLGLLSVSLAFMNLLPIPGLDGGHLAYYCYEGIVRRPLPEKLQLAGLRLGFVLLIALAAIAIGNDLRHLS